MLIPLEIVDSITAFDSGCGDFCINLINRHVDPDQADDNHVYKDNHGDYYTMKSVLVSGDCSIQMIEKDSGSFLLIEI